MELSPHPHGCIHCAIDFIYWYLIGIFHVYTYRVVKFRMHIFIRMVLWYSYTMNKLYF